MATNRIQTGLRLNTTTYDKLRILSVRETRSLNNFIEYVLQQYIDHYEAEHGIIPISSSSHDKK